MKYEPLLHIVLYQPEIPHNTGSVGRTCVAVGAKLWLVRPLGFRLDDYYLRRAGLDYWEHLEWEAVDDWNALSARLWEAMPAESSIGASTAHATATMSVAAPRRPWLFSKTASRAYTSARFVPGDVLVFGCETRGLPPSMLEAHPESVLGIPIRPQVRSLNLSNAVAIVAYEARRQSFCTP